MNMTGAESLPKEEQLDWEEAYQQGRTGWDRGQVNAALHQWLQSSQLQPCRILLPGCGYGHEVCELAQRGFDVTGIDLAPSATRALGQKLAQLDLQANVIEGNLFDQTLPSFDAIYEQTCLCATPPAQWQAYAQWLWQHLQPGGHLFALFMQTGEEGGPPYHCELSAMRTLFDEQYWQWPEDSSEIQSQHHHGRFERGWVLRRI